jgi:hypothetical protein
MNLRDGSSSRNNQMTNDPLKSPSLQSGYAGDEPILDEFKESSKSDDVRSEAKAGSENRGRRAPQHGSGAVVGSGAGAGGGGGAEDFDDDAKSGGGSLSMTPDKASKDKYGDGNNENSA